MKAVKPVGVLASLAIGVAALSVPSTALAAGNPHTAVTASTTPDRCPCTH